MFINNISASRSDIIDQCLWKYYLKYVLRIPGFGSPNEESLNFGSYIHKIFEHGIGCKDLKSLLKLAEEHKSNYKIPFRETDRTKKCLENFLVWNQNLGETVSTEISFNVSLDKANDINFIGVIDRVIRGSEGGYLVIDYKTSKTEKKKKDLLDDKQLQGYAYAIHVMYDVPIEKITCAHYYPLTNNFVPVKFARFQIDRWKKKEIDKVWRIRKKKSNEFYEQENKFCDWCEMKPVCRRFNSEEVVCKRLDEQKELKKKLDEQKKTSTTKDQLNSSTEDKDPSIIG